MISRRWKLHGEEEFKGTWQGEREKKGWSCFMRLGGDWIQCTYGESNLVRQREITFQKNEKEGGKLGINARQVLWLGQEKLTVKGFYTWLSLVACALKMYFILYLTHYLYYLLTLYTTCIVKYVLHICFFHIVFSIFVNINDCEY